MCERLFRPVDNVLTPPCRLTKPEILSVQSKNTENRTAYESQKRSVAYRQTEQKGSLMTFRSFLSVSFAIVLDYEIVILQCVNTGSYHVMKTG